MCTFVHTKTGCLYNFRSMHHEIYCITQDTFTSAGPSAVKSKVSQSTDYSKYLGT